MADNLRSPPNSLKRSREEPDLEHEASPSHKRPRKTARCRRRTRHSAAHSDDVSHREAKQKHRSARDGQRATRLTSSALKRVPKREAGTTATWVTNDSIPSLEMSSASVSTQSRKRSRLSSPAASRRSSALTSATASSSWDANVPQILADNGIYGPADSQPPKNLDAIKERMMQRRGSLSPNSFSDTLWSDFVRKNDRARNEGQISTKCLPLFTSDSPFPDNVDTLFNHLDPLVSEDFKIPAPKPDVSTGIDMTSVPLEIRRPLAQYIVPAIGAEAILPNDFIEVKGPHGSGASLVTQVSHNGAAGSRAMHKLRTFRSEDGDEPDGVARTFHMTLHGGPGAVSFYVSHAQRGESTEPAVTYHTTRVGGELVVSSPEHLRKALTIFRNLRDMAAEEREEAVKLAKSRCKLGSSPGTAAAANGPHPQTSNDGREACSHNREATPEQSAMPPPKSSCPLQSGLRPSPGPSVDDSTATGSDPLCKVHAKQADDTHQPQSKEGRDPT